MFLIRVESSGEAEAVNKYFEDKGYRAIPNPSKTYNCYKRETTTFVDTLTRSLSFASFKFYSKWHRTKNLPIVKIISNNYRGF